MAALMVDFLQSVNPLYLYEAVQDQMRTSFTKSKPSVLLLSDFFSARAYANLNKVFSGLKESRVFQAERFSFTQLELKQADRAFFSSPAFFDFVRNATGLKVRDVRLHARRFCHTDFTLLHDDQESKERFLFIYMCVPVSWKPSFGGSLIFSFGDDRDPLVFEPKPNSFILFRAQKDMREFVKYVNHFAGSESVMYIVGEFLTR